MDYSTTKVRKFLEGIWLIASVKLGILIPFEIKIIICYMSILTCVTYHRLYTSLRLHIENTFFIGSMCEYTPKHSTDML